MKAGKLKNSRKHMLFHLLTTQYLRTKKFFESTLKSGVQNESLKSFPSRRTNEELYIRTNYKGDT